MTLSDQDRRLLKVYVHGCYSSQLTIDLARYGVANDIVRWCGDLYGTRQYCLTTHGHDMLDRMNTA